MSAEPILELEQITAPTRRDPELPALQKVNWTVRAGEFWVLGGLQGSGKSDLLALLAVLTKPLAGAYRLWGADVGQHFGDRLLPTRLRIGMVFDDSRLFNHLTLAENVALPARYHHNLHLTEAEGWVGALLKATGVAELADQLPGSVSRGWRKRAALARALALKPELLILENPLRGLDARQGAWWVEFVRQLWRGHDLLSGRPLTIIASTDEFRPWRLSEAQFALLHEGQFEVMGPVAPEDDVAMTRTELITREGTI